MASKHDLLPVPCLYCGERFATLTQADRHMLRVHPEDYRPSAEEEAERAGIRARKWASHLAYTRSQADLIARLPFKCANCNKRFSTEAGAVEHAAAAHRVDITRLSSRM